MSLMFTADTHFGSSGIIRYCLRHPLTDEQKSLVTSGEEVIITPQMIEEHDQFIIDRLNSRLSRSSTLYIIGDFCHGTYEEARKYVNRIKCSRINLIYGNHDHPSIRHAFDEVYDLLSFKHDGKRLFLSHYPCRSWDGSHHGSWNIYGHVHGNEPPLDNFTLAIDAGVDPNDYYPISFEQIAKYMAPREVQWKEYAKIRFGNKERGGMATRRNNNLG